MKFRTVRLVDYIFDYIKLQINGNADVMATPPLCKHKKRISD